MVNLLAGQTVFVFLGYVFTFLVGLPLQIFVARSLGSTNLGIFSLLEGGFGVLSGLLAFGLAPTLVKFIPEHLAKGQNACIATLVLRGAIILLCAGGVGVALVLGAMQLGLLAWIGPDVAPILVLVMSLLIPLGIMNFFLQQGLRGFLDLRYVVLGGSVLQLSIKAAATVLLLELGFGLLGWASATVIALGITVVFMAVGLWRKCAALPADDPGAPAVRPQDWRAFAMVQYSGSLVSIGSSYADRFLLGLTAGASVVGAYAVVAQLQSIPRILLNMLLTVATPMLSSAHAINAPRTREHIYHLATDWSVRGALPFMIFLIMFADDILMLYGAEFRDRGHLALIIAILVQTLNLIVGPIGAVLTMSGQERAVLRLAIYQQAVALSSLVLLVPALGLIGVILSQGCATLFINVAEMRLARSRLHLRWWDTRYRLWFVPAFVTAVTALACRNLAGDTTAFMLLAYLIALIVLFHAVSLLQGFHDDDRELLGSFQAKIRALWLREV